MELFSQLLLPLFILFVFFLAFRNKRYKRYTNLPPGQFGWPILGESLEFISLSKKGNLAKFLKDRTQKYSTNLFKTSLFGEDVIVLCGPVGNKFLFSNENRHLTYWWPPSLNKILTGNEKHNFIVQNGESFKLFSHSFLLDFVKLDALPDYVPIMDSTAQNHLKMHWAPDKDVKVAPLARNFSFLVACRLLLNLDDTDKIAHLSVPFNQIIQGVVSVPINFPGTAYYKALKAGVQIRKEFRPIIRQRISELREKSETARDLLNWMLLSTQKNGKIMNETDMVNDTIGILFASHETMSTTITFLVYYLSDFPHVYDRVSKEQMDIANSKKIGELLNWDDIQKMKYSWNAAREVLRLAPPANGGFREAIHDLTYDGFTIPKGWKIFWTVHSTHRNPDYFPNPDKFDPSRFERNETVPFTFLPFGGGPRMCQGKEFARLEILVFLHNLITKFKWEKCIPDEKIVYIPTPTPEHGLPIRVRPLNLNCPVES